MAENIVRYGLKNVHVASVEVKNDEVTFGKPQPWKGAVNLSLEPAGDSAEFYADDILYFVGSVNNGYEGKLECALVPEWFKIEYMGMKKDSQGNIIETAEDVQKQFALLFEFTGDAKAIRHIMYYCKATGRPTLEGETKGDGVEVKTEELSFKATPIPTGTPYIKANTTEKSANYETWYSATPTLPTDDPAGD